jgi:hypothetical protein
MIDNLRKFLQDANVTEFWVIVFFASITSLSSLVIIATPQLPGPLIILAAVIMLIVLPFYERYVFYLLLLILDLNVLWVTMNKALIVEEPLVFIVLFNVLIIVIAEMFWSVISERTVTEMKLREKNKVLESIMYFVKQTGDLDDWEKNIDVSLGKLGASVDVSRVYIFENTKSPDGKIVTYQKHEWVAEGIESQMDNQNLQALDYIEVGFVRWLDHLSKRKPIVGNIVDFPASEEKILADQDIVSMLVVPIFVNNMWWGLIGFDDCKSTRYWDQGLVDTLKMFAELIDARIYTGRNYNTWKRKIEEVEKINKYMTDRELAMIDLKAEIKELKSKLRRKEND